MLRKNEQLVTMLREATPKPDGGGLTERLRPFMNEIEAAQARGVSRISLVETLAQYGIDISVAALDSILHRHRKKQGRAKKSLSARKGKSPRQMASASSHPENKPTQAPADPADRLKDRMSRLNKIMRSTPDLAELTRLAKETRKDKT